MAGTTEQRQRLREYGMHIGQSRAGIFELYPESGKVVSTFSTYEEAYDAFEQLVERFWDAHVDSFYELARQMSRGY